MGVSLQNETDAHREAMSIRGDCPVNLQCLPHNQIPHTTRLFLDFLSHSSTLRQFYPRSPIFREWMRDESSLVGYDDARRARVSAILERQNRAWGSSGKTLTNVERLRHGALAAVTGQQVGLFGGPLFSIFKALTSVKLAEEATNAGVDCVPVFWLATEDHDLAEINHVSLLSAQGLPERFATESHGVADAPVGSIVFGREIESVVARAVALLGESEPVVWLRESYRTGETLGGAFARLFARIFADWGVILLDPSDKQIHQVVKPILRAALERAPELDDALLSRGKALEAAGYHQQVKVTPASTLLFEVRNGARMVVRRRANGLTEAEFSVGQEKASQRQLLDRLESDPENFNPNVLLRPVVQDYLLPTLTYTGGAAEVAYFAQVGVVYEKLLGRVTPVLPRFSATLLEPKAERILTRYKLSLPDLFHGIETVTEAMARLSLPADLQQRFSDAYAGAEKSMTTLRDAIDKLDPTLVRSSDRARMRMWHQINSLHRRAARAELFRNEVIVRHAETVCGSLVPHKVLQEREIGGISFLAHYGRELLTTIYEAIHTDCHDHRIISLA